MVNNTTNVSAYSGQPPSEAGSKRIHIEGGPLYAVTDVLALLDAGDEQTVLWTRKCVADVQQLAYGISDIRALLKQALTGGQYLKSEWCVQKPTGPWAACDSYRLQRIEWIEHAHKEMHIEYYVKFAIGKTGKLLLLVSCHIS